MWGKSISELREIKVRGARAGVCLHTLRCIPLSSMHAHVQTPTYMHMAGARVRAMVDGDARGDILQLHWQG